MVWELSFSGLDSENPYHHLREFELVCSCCAIVGMTRDTLRWKLFPFSLVEVARQLYTRTVVSMNGNWVNLEMSFVSSFSLSPGLLLYERISSAFSRMRRNL